MSVHCVCVCAKGWGKGRWVGPVCTFWYECPLVVLACESLHVRTVCIWRCEHARFHVEVFLRAIYKFSFIHSFNHNPRVEALRQF